MRMDYTAMGRAGLTGWRQKVGSRVAERASGILPLTKEQIEALLGAIFLLLALREFYLVARRVWRAGKGVAEDDLAGRA